jgi:hypothetical protein
LTLSRNFLYSLISILFVGAIHAQNEGNDLYDHRLDEEKWGELREGIRYEGQKNGPGREWTYNSKADYEKAKRAYEKGGGSGTGGGNGNGSGNESGTGQGNGGNQNGGSQRPQESSDYHQESTPSSTISTGNFGFFGYIMIGIFVVALAFLIYYMFVNRQKDGAKVGAPLELEEINPSEIPLTELERLLREAISKGDYRGAIRIYFIFIIRDLSTKKWISWQKEKTNFHYLREMSGKNEFDDFNRSVSYFEIIWYGKREIDSAKFEQIRPSFTRFLDKLGVK